MFCVRVTSCWGGAHGPWIRPCCTETRNDEIAEIAAARLLHRTRFVADAGEAVHIRDTKRGTISMSGKLSTQNLRGGVLLTVKPFSHWFLSTSKTAEF